MSFVRVAMSVPARLRTKVFGHSSRRVERVRTGGPLNTPDPATFYGGGAAGYTDYPTHTA
jgi:N-ethylmaleimide reductase